MFAGASGRIGGLMFMGIGLLLLALCVHTAMATRSFIRTATRAEGTVTRLIAGGSHPEIEFSTGEHKKILYSQGGLIFGFRPGDRVKVLFDAANPSGTATIDAVGALWFTTLVSSALGTMSLIAGASAWWR